MKKILLLFTAFFSVFLFTSCNPEIDHPIAGNVYAVALTTLIAAESTGAFAGLGMRIRSFNNSYEVEPMLLYIILIGIIGITIEKIIKFLEKKLTGWQETRNV